MRAKFTAIAVLMAEIMLPGYGQEAEWPAAKPEAVKAWQDMRFGMFIHWGPVSLTGKEIGWSRGAETPIEKYDSLYKEFNPTKFNADEWVSVAKAAGMKYIVLTTKHHDGFCLWDTKYTDYNIMNSPFKRDVVKELSEACKKQGIKFGTYYSVCDWHHPDFPLTSPGGRVRRPKSDMDAYQKYLLNQIRELVTNYGPLVTIWNDVPQEFGGRGTATIKMVRELQPDILVNDRSGDGGDYSTPEQSIGGFNNTRPWETCMTICNQWAWKPNDPMKSLPVCLRALILCAGGDGNLLLNVGPMPSGEIEARQVERLKEMGAWLERYGPSIYGTRGGPFKPNKRLVSTHQGNVIYVHVFGFLGETLTLPRVPKKVVSVSLLTGGKVQMTETEEELVFTVAKPDQQAIDTIIKLQLDGSAEDIAPLVGAKAGLIKPTMKAKASNVYLNQQEYSAGKAIDGDENSRWATDAGTKQAWLEVDLGQPMRFGAAAIDETYAGRVQSFELQYKEGDGWKTFHKGTTVGADFVARFEPVTAQVVRLNILQANEGPTIAEFQLLAK